MVNFLSKAKHVLFFVSKKYSNTTTFVTRRRVMHSSSSRNHSLTCGSNLASRTRLYWPCFIVTFLMPLTKITEHTKAIDVESFSRISPYKRTFVKQILEGWFVEKVHNYHKEIPPVQSAIVIFRCLALSSRFFSYCRLGLGFYMSQMA